MNGQRVKEAGLLIVLVLLGACGAASPVDSADRAVAITTTACGDASKTNGSGVIVGPGRVLTAAHVVVGATTISIDTGEAVVSADLTVLDTNRDLAIVTVNTGALATDEPVTLASAGADEPLIVVGATSGPVDLSVDRVLTLRADNVREPGRSERAGYELAASLLPGDSGAGIFDAEHNLVGVVFAGPADRDGRVFAVDETEIDAVMNAAGRDWSCDLDDSRVRPSS